MSASGASIRSLAWVFLRLGATGFGGPAAHIAMMHDEVVRRRQWLAEQQFLDLLAIANLIPGPTSTELAIHVGWQQGRWAGLAVAGISFIAPAVLITGVLAWAYVEWGHRPAFSWLLYGTKPVVLAIVAQAVVLLAPKAARTRQLRVLAALSAIGAALGADELLVLFGAGVAAVLVAGRGSGPAPGGRTLGHAALLPLAAGAASAGAASVSGIFWVFAKIGSVVFGSGYVLLAFLRADLVERLGWLTEAQLIDAVVVGQVTPGPVFTTATFIGYLLQGPSGACAATAGIFLPAFVFVALSGPLIPRLRASHTAGAFLDGVAVASLALMVVVTVQLARAAVPDVASVLLALAAAAALFVWRCNATWVMLGGALAGWGLHACGLVP